MRFIRTAESIFGVPLGFKRVEYLQSTGTQYIDTEYVMTSGNSSTWEGRMMWTQSDGNANFFYGYRSVNQAEYRGDMRAFFIYGASPAGRLAIRYGVNTDNSTQVAVSLNTPFKMSFDGNNLKVNDVTQVSLTTAYTPANYNSMWLFWCNCTGYYSADVNHFIGRIYYWKIWDNGVLVRDFIPCLDSLGVPCMYDLVGKKAYYNIGTGTFTAGRQVIPVKYLESTGTQYIDTGYAFTDGFSWEIDFEGISDGATLFGGRTSSTRTALLYQRNYGGIDLTTCPIAGYNGQETPFQLTDLRLGRHTIKMSVALNKGSILVDGVQIYNEQSFTGNYISGTTQALFADKFGDNDYREQSSSKVYGLKMWQGANLVRDFIPCKDENNVGYMFDKVSGICYLNAGTGAFSFGENKYTSKLRLIKKVISIPAGCTEVEYLESTGTQYIDTGILGNGEFDVDYLYYQTEDSTNAIFAGARSASQHLNFGQRAAGTGGFSMSYLGSFWKAGSSPSINTDIRVQISYKSGSQTGSLNDIALTGNTLTGTEATNLSIYLFKRHHYGTDDVSGLVGRMYYFKLWNNGTLVRDMIPVLDWNMTPCMYDKVSGQFFYNQGTGSFSYGREIHRVEYLESTGTQYIDTRYIPNTNTYVEMYAMYTALDSTYRTPFSVRTSDGAANSFTIAGATSTANVYAFGSRYWAKENGCPDASTNVKYFMSLKSGEANFNGVTGNAGTTITPTTLKAYMFARNANGTAANFFKGRIYNCLIKENNTLVHDYIPAIDENGIGYMFDRVSHTCYLNKGTGSFLVGRPVCKVRFIKDIVPREYTVVNYIESTGTQYINTGIYPAQLTKAQIDMQFTSITKCSVLGSNNGASQDAGWNNLFGSNLTGNITDKFWCQWGQGWNGAFTKDLNRHTHTFERNGNTSWTYTVDTTSFTNTTGISTQPTNNQRVMYLFACNNNGVLYREASVKMYCCIIWNNGVPVRDFYPALRKSDNKPGMYDRITKQFFVNQGTGEFNYG